MNTFRYFEDFHPGETIALGTRTVNAEEIVAFASEFDPQPFHLDEEAGRASLLGGLAASGWHTASLMMRLLFDHLLAATSCMGSPGIPTLKWRKPLLAGDTIHARAEILSVRRSGSKPQMGIVSFRFTATNQKGETVMEQENPILFGCRDTPGAPDEDTGTDTAQAQL